MRGLLDARRMVFGVVLGGALTRLEPGKRPRSSMAPMIVLKEGVPIMAIGSPGGSAIINYVAKVLSNIQVYRARLGEPDPLRLQDDLYRARAASARPAVGGTLRATSTADSRD